MYVSDSHYVHFAVHHLSKTICTKLSTMLFIMLSICFAKKENTPSKPTLTTAKTTTKIFVQKWFQIPSTSKGSIITFTGLIMTQWSKLIHTNSSNIYTLLCSSIQTIINNISITLFITLAHAPTLELSPVLVSYKIKRELETQKLKHIQLQLKEIKLLFTTLVPLILPTFESL